MPLVLLGLAALAVVALAFFWFMRANPSGLARMLRFALVGLSAVGIGGLLIFGLRFIPGMLPELLGLCDRIYALSAGRITGELDGRLATQENLMELMTKERESDR